MMWRGICGCWEWVRGCRGPGNTPGVRRVPLAGWRRVTFRPVAPRRAAVGVFSVPLSQITCFYSSAQKFGAIWMVFPGVNVRVPLWICPSVWLCPPLVCDGSCECGLVVDVVGGGVVWVCSVVDAAMDGSTAAGRRRAAAVCGCCAINAQLQCRSRADPRHSIRGRQYCCWCFSCRGGGWRGCCWGRRLQCGGRHHHGGRCGAEAARVELPASR